MTTKMLILLIFFGFSQFSSSNPTVNEAIKYNNIKQALDEFAYNNTLDMGGVLAKQQLEFGAFTGGHDYNPGSASSTFEEGTEKTTLSNHIAQNIWKFSEKFKTKLLEALSKCDYYMDREFGAVESSDGRQIGIFKILFQKEPDNTYTYMFIRYKNTFEVVDEKIWKFWQCASVYGAKVSDCAPTAQFTFAEFVEFKKWYEQLATVNFVQGTSQQRKLVMIKVQQLAPYLPPGYKPMPKCSIWPTDDPDPDVDRCKTVTDPGYATAMATFKNWLRNDTTSADAADANPAKFKIVCDLDATGFLQILREWVNMGAIDEQFRSLMLRTSARDTGGPYFVREAFFAAAENPGHLFTYVRVVVFQDFSSFTYNVGLTYHSAETPGATIQVKGTYDVICGDGSKTCTLDRIIISQNDKASKDKARQVALQQINV